jgi:hypothetical protein
LTGHVDHGVSGSRKKLSSLVEITCLKTSLMRRSTLPRQIREKEITMKYMLLLYGNEAQMQGRPKAAADQALEAYGAYTEAMKKAGILLDGNRLKPTNSASTVRVANGNTKVLDGPYAETKEQLGGYYMIDVPDLDAALSWAARCPAASHGAVEVRPIWVM